MMATRIGGDGRDDDASHRIASHAGFAAIWAYALGAGFVAVGVTKVIAVLVHPSNVRVPLQWATIPAVALVAGLACERVLARLRSVIAFRRPD